jgi:hypothetical protein
MFENIEKTPHDIKDRIEDAANLGLDMVEEIPTVRQVNGVWETGKMPTSAGVQTFIGKLTAEYLQPITNFAPYSSMDIHDFNRWWDTYRSVHSPINDWATSLTDHEEALLEYACKVLSSNAVGTTVLVLKQSGIYPANWSSMNGLFRSTTERLFDRLRLNHIKYSGTVKRWPVWWGHDQNESPKEYPPLTTVFGRRHDDNGFYLLRKKLSSGYNTLGDIVGLTEAPDNFAMPLQWTEAIFSGLVPDVKAKLSESVRDSLDDFADDLESAVNSASNTSLWGGIIGGIAATLFGAPVLGGLLVLFGSQSNKLVNSIDHWPGKLRSAGAEGGELNDTAYYLLNMLRTTDFKGLFGNKLEDALDLDNKVFMLDLYHDQVQDVEYAMRPDLVNSAVTFQPMILLGDTFASYASGFGVNPKYGVNPFKQGEMKGPDNVVSKQRNTAKLWTTWWNDSQPTLDVAYVIDTASIVLEQLLHIDDALLALNDIAVGDGAVAMIVRRVLSDRGLTRFVDALGGASPSAALRYFFRQLLTDLFIDWFRVKEDVAATDLYPLFTWMNTRTKRDRIEDALGPLVEVTPDNAGGMWGMISALRTLFEYVPDPQLSGNPGDKLMLRGAFLPGARNNQKGALGRIFELFGQYPDDPERAVNEISHCDLGNLRGWLELARLSHLVGLKDSLEPAWSYDSNSSGGYIPPDLPGDIGPRDQINPQP